MFVNKAVPKRKEWSNLANRFGNDLKSLENISLEKTKELLLEVEKYNRKLESEFTKIKAENKMIISDCRMFEEQQKLLAESNAELHQKLIASEVISDVSEVLQISFMNAVEKMGGKSFINFTKEVEKLRAGVLEFCDILQKNKDPLMSLSDRPETQQISELLEKTTVDLNHKFKVINLNMGELDSSLELLMKDFRNMYLTLSQPDEPKILERFLLNDLLICSKKKLSSNTRLFSNLKKDLIVQKAEYVALTRRTESAENENYVLKTQLHDLETSCRELQQGLNSVSQLKTNNETEINGHMEALQALQHEQFRLNTHNQELKSKVLDLTTAVDSLILDKKVLNEKIGEINSQYISAQRQDRLKLSQSKNDIQQLEEKVANTEKMLNSENQKYENLFSKYRDLKEAHVKHIQSRDDEIKKLTKSFDGKTNDESQTNERRGKDTSNSLNQSGLKTPKNTQELIGFWKGRKKDEQLELILEELEDLKFQVLTSQFQLATERRILDEWVTQNDAEKMELYFVFLIDHFKPTTENRSPDKIFQKCLHGNSET